MFVSRYQRASVKINDVHIVNIPSWWVKDCRGLTIAAFDINAQAATWKAHWNKRNPKPPNAALTTSNVVGAIDADNLRYGIVPTDGPPNTVDDTIPMMMFARKRECERWALRVLGDHYRIVDYWTAKKLQVPKQAPTPPPTTPIPKPSYIDIRRKFIHEGQCIMDGGFSTAGRVTELAAKSKYEAGDLLEQLARLVRCTETAGRPSGNQFVIVLIEHTDRPAKL